MGSEKAATGPALATVTPNPLKKGVKLLFPSISQIFLAIPNGEGIG